MSLGRNVPTCLKNVDEDTSRSVSLKILFHACFFSIFQCFLFQILFMSFFIITHAFVQTLGGSIISGLSDTVKSLKSFNPLSNVFSRGAENQANIYKATSREAVDPSQGIEDYFRNAIAKLDSFKPLSVPLSTIKSLAPVNKLRVGGEGPDMQVDATHFVRTGEAEPVLLKSPQYLPLPLKMADPGHGYIETSQSVIEVNE